MTQSLSNLESSKSYLHPYVTYDPQSIIDDANAKMTRSTLVIVAEVIIVIAAVIFLAIAVSFNIWFYQIAIVNELYLMPPILAISLTLSILSLIFFLEPNSIDTSQEKVFVTRMKKYVDIDQKLKSLGINFKEISSDIRSKLKPLIARYEILTEKVTTTTKYLKEKKQTLQQALASCDNIRQDDIKYSEAHLVSAKKRRIIASGKPRINRLKNKIALYKLDIAYTLKVLQNPTEEKSSSSYYKNFNSSSKYIETDKKIFTRKEILQKTSLELAKEVFSLKN